MNWSRRRHSLLFSLLLVMVVSRAATSQTPLKITDDAITSVSFSADGRLLAVGGADGTLKVGSPVAWEKARDLRGPLLPYHRITDVRFAHKRQLLAVAGMSLKRKGDVLLGRSFVIDIWNTETYEIIWSANPAVHKNAINRLDFTPNDGVLIATDSSGRILLWDLKVQSEPVRTIPVMEPVASLAAWTKESDRVYLLSGASFTRGKEEKTLRQWTLTGEEQKAPYEQSYPISSICVNYAKPGIFAVGGGRFPFLDLWNGKQRVRLELHAGAVTGLVFSPSGEILISGDARGFVYFWDVRKEEPAIIKNLFLKKSVLQIDASKDFVAIALDDGSVVLEPIPALSRASKTM